MAMFKAGNAFSKKQPTAVPKPAPAPAPTPAAPRLFGNSGMTSMSRAKAPVAAPTRSAPTNNPMSAGALYVGMPRTGRTAPTVSPQVAQQMAATGPRMPAMAKGGMTKKTGYAKGGAVMCGASMPPAQKRKK